MSEKKRILMVCLGNICRSPIAEAVLQAKINKSGTADRFEVDSAAIEAWHSDDPPDPRAISVMKNRGLNYTGTARQIQAKDFDEFDYVFGMDEDNVKLLRRLAPEGCKAKLLLLGDFGLSPEERNIHDPYYFVGEAPFEEVFDKCMVACDAFYKELEAGNI